MRWLGWFVNPHDRVNPKPNPELLMVEDAAYIPIPGRTDQDNHEHALVAIDIQPTVRQPFVPATTIVLFGCKMCSFVRADTIPGQWTLDQITALHRQQGGYDAA